MARTNREINDVWAVTAQSAGPELPMLFVHQDDLWWELERLLMSGHELPAELPMVDPFAIYCFSDGRLGWCNFREEGFTGPGAYQLYPISDLTDHVDVNSGWSDLVKSEGIVMICAYSDIFLAEYLSKSRDFSSIQALRFFDTSHVGIARVMKIL